MNKNETLAIMALINAHIPQQFAGLSKETKNGMLKLWLAKFKEYEYREVENAIHRYIDSDTKGYIPTVGIIKSHMYKIANPNTKTELEAWNILFACLSKFNLTAEFEKLDKVSKRILGTVATLRQWSMMDIDTVQSVIASNFQRSYRAMAASQRETDISTPGGCALLNGTETKKLEGENK